ncbi:metallo-dependent hydrolase [uncultured Flavonifractor sp.]|uniref:metallo-dependent hydrolase n=1 Tax=uncultured Flavonifractor sp. TaxID=1193534 RepID=UPI0025F2766D|nr:metallo-dependent hydrolase [uncultured Flavonifractor sp.]
MNFLIKGGMLYDPLAQKMRMGDLAIIAGRIADPNDGQIYRQEIDASGCYVTPGLIDFHVHYFHGATSAGVAPDSNSFCSGVTTVVDGGSSGTTNYEFYRNTIMANSQVDIFNQLLIAAGGQITDCYPENMDADRFDENAIVRLFQRYRENLKGIKLRLSKSILDRETAVRAIVRAKEIAFQVQTPLVVHVTDCPLPLDEVASYLSKDDVICHIYHGQGKNTCLDQNGRVLSGLFEARKRGVLFDSCNGWKNFDLSVARAAIEQGFYPDIISSDLNSSSNFLQPLYCLPRVMSKYLDFGMSLENVFNAAIASPAKCIHEEELASLAAGTKADICIFKLKRKAITHTDFNCNTLTGAQILVPMMTFKNGICVYCQSDFG